MQKLEWQAELWFLVCSDRKRRKRSQIVDPEVIDLVDEEQNIAGASGDIGSPRVQEMSSISGNAPITGSSSQVKRKAAGKKGRKRAETPGMYCWSIKKLSHICARP